MLQGVSMAPQVGLEPTTLRLTAECSAIELLRNMESGSDLLSRAVSSQVPSALKGLTSVFGMGTGVAPSLSPPERVNEICRGSGAAALSAMRLLNSRPFLPPFSPCRCPVPLRSGVSLGASFRFRLKAFALQQCSALRTLTTAQRIEYRFSF